MGRSILVLGAGMVGTATALQLQSRGWDVTLVDRRGPGQETSHGNAGVIQREAVEPYAFPRDPKFLLRTLLGVGAEVNWHAKGLWQMAGPLMRYFRNSHPVVYAGVTKAYSQLIAGAIDGHATWIEAAGAQDLVERKGFRFVYRTRQAFDLALARAQSLEQRLGIRHAAQDGLQLSALEPALQRTMAGALHWLDPWSVRDPGGLVQRYAHLFEQRGGRIQHGDAHSLMQVGKGWTVRTDSGPVQARQAVVALGPWSDGLLGQLGYRYPLFIKRGYHQHYQAPQTLRQPLLDAERGYVLAPMSQGLRLTTGAEFAPLTAAPTPVQLEKARASAREIIQLGEAMNTAPWLGARPCTADMLPVIGAAPRHKGLWFNFGHGHQGFTLGPVTGGLLAEMIGGQPTAIDPTPYLPNRFD